MQPWVQPLGATKAPRLGPAEGSAPGPLVPVLRAEAVGLAPDAAVAAAAAIAETMTAPQIAAD